MDAPAPFTTTTPSSCRLAWDGGSYLPPSWRDWSGVNGVDRAGFHALVRAAGLTVSELRRMGFKDHELREGATWFPMERAVVLLGRIAWDAKRGDAGEVWDDTLWQRVDARGLGEAVVKAWFR